MMSHLSGASTCVDRGRLSKQDRQIDSLTREVQTLRQRYQSTSDALREQTRLTEQEKLKGQRLQAQMLEAQRLEQKTITNDSSARAANDPRMEQLLHRLSELQNSLSAEKETVKQQTQTISHLEAFQQTLVAEQSAPPLPMPKTASANTAGDLKLCGQCVLYLGGKAQQRRHFQALVESCDGRFLHHDGGRETCPHRISELVSQADVVMCPTNCISHSAMQKARTLCARQDKPIVFMQRSSMSAFTRSLRETLGQD
ncbi:DUF2325 domain-containing protein [Granulosicoccus antarcticus]|uniref:Uncharacterized protein n=1 Tax=Granulosicoccus antarcticus IMCC3135 TaxID=1192854 RepID=A0A2Z2NVW0_9GAMM|nr:DUF2325 domain-containing protein [Granulosicoccus antarcticus]ASJ71294.1 hypothetical protein IMCC3135_05910 [Granulosicoccus antarcticus IMCC3135]